MALSSATSYIPEMDTIDDKHNKLIDEFLAAFKAHTDKSGEQPVMWQRLQGVEEGERIMAYKYLTARKWKVKDAMAMATHTADWRKETKVDDLVLFPTAFRAFGYDNVDEINQVLGRPVGLPGDEWSANVCKSITPAYQSGFQYWDREGHPVLVMFFGRCNVRGLFKRYQQVAHVGQKPVQVADRYHTYENEVGVALCRYRDSVNRSLPEGHPDKVNRRILGLTCIIDCAELGYGHLWNPILDIVKSQFVVDASHYPEGLHRVLVINCPTMIKFAYTIVKGALDARVQQKIVFCKAGKETTETLRAIIDPKYLPTFHGGDWVVPADITWGNTMPDSTTANDAASDAHTEDIHVSAGKVHAKEYHLGVGDEVSWEFSSTTGHDIEFEVVFLPGAQLLESGVTDRQKSVIEAGVPVIPLNKLHDGADCYCANQDGVLRLLWSNKASWFKGKHLQMRIIKRESAGM